MESSFLITGQRRDFRFFLFFWKNRAIISCRDWDHEINQLVPNMLYHYNIRTEKPQMQPRHTTDEKFPTHHVCPDETGVLLSADEIFKFAKKNRIGKQILQLLKTPTDDDDELSRVK